MGTIDPDSLARLRGVISKLARELNASSTVEDLTPTQASVLGLISARGPLRVAELAELEGINPTMLSRVISNLAGRDLIERYVDTADQRVVTVQSTRSGRRLHERIRSLRTNAVARCLDRMSKADAKTIVDALPALEGLVGQLRGESAARRGRAAVGANDR
jgi:DNA-binding MarR family transcriptional regulator